MCRKINSRHLAFLEHTLIVHDTVILPAIAAGCVQEQDLLITLARLFVEDLGSAPERRGDVDVSANDVVVVALWLFVRGCGADERVVEDLEDSSPDVRPTYC